jgi:DNA-binding XRE family transcriptional regulator
MIEKAIRRGCASTQPRLFVRVTAIIEGPSGSTLGGFGQPPNLDRDSLSRYYYTIGCTRRSSIWKDLNPMSSHQLSPKNPLPTPFTIAVGQRIRQARKERNMSQRRLADRIERRQGTISDYENGKMQPDATTLVTRGLDL